MRNLLVLCIIAIIILTNIPNIFADDSIVYDNGRTVYPINTDKISMLSEKVIVKILSRSRNKAYAWMENLQANVSCEFVFKNTTTETIKAKLGFPINETSYPGNETSPPELNNFISFIEGKTVDVEMKEDKDVKGRYWYIWDVTFPPSSIIHLSNEYDVPLSESAGFSRFEYILTTGANWKGPIGKAVIEVEYENGEELKTRVANIGPMGYKLDGNKIVWEFTDFTPTKNIVISEIPPTYHLSAALGILGEREYEGDKRFYNSDDLIMDNNEVVLRILANSTRSRVFMSQYDDTNEIMKYYVWFLRNEIFARHGRVFNSVDLQWKFNQKNWYKKNPNYSDDMLNDFEKKNIQFILDYEKKMGWR